MTVGGVLAAASTSAPAQPWWGIPTFTLAGIIFGALITQGVTIYINNKRSASEKTAAMQAMRREALVTLIAAGSDYLAAAPDEVAQKGAALRHASSQCDLILDGEITGKATNYFSAIVELRRQSAQAIPESNVKAFLNALEELKEAAKADRETFGLPESTTPNSLR